MAIIGLHILKTSHPKKAGEIIKEDNKGIPHFVLRNIVHPIYDDRQTK